MSFNDFMILKDKDYAIMKQNYNQILEHETNDLKEIYSKMIEQKKSLEKINMDGRYDRVIEKINNNIFEMESLISTNTSNLIYSPKNEIFPQTRNLWSQQNNLPNSNEGAISPIRSEREIEYHNNQSNIDSNIPNQNPTTPPITEGDPIPPTNRANISKRNSPMQSPSVPNFFKSFALNWKKQKKSILQDIEDNAPKNKFHNIHSLHNSCEPRNILIGSQIDIIRLLLLYMALRPNCRYISRIASMTNDQFDILLNIQER